MSLETVPTQLCTLTRKAAAAVKNQFSIRAFNQDGTQINNWAWYIAANGLFRKKA
jgi:hypothetical protein